MKTQKIIQFVSFISLLSAFVFVVLLTPSFAQRRDNMTDKEDMQVREAQDFDLRIKAYVKIIDRRLLAMSDPKAAENKQVMKDIDIWGDVRVGESKDLYWDIQKTLDEAVGKIDDVAERDHANPLFSKAVHILSDACKKWTPEFKSGLDKTLDEKEKGLITNTIETCSLVIEAAAKIPKDEKKKKKD